MTQSQKKLPCIITAVCLVVLIVSTHAYAGCRVSTTSINFGRYDVFSSAPATSSGSITISCTHKTDVTIAIGASPSSGSFYPRTMHHTVHSDTLNYNLYTTENRTHIWGDGAHGTQVIHLSNVTNSTPPVRIFGMIDPIQNVSTGSYSDQLIVTIMY